MDVGLAPIRQSFTERRRSALLITLPEDSAMVAA